MKVWTIFAELTESIGIRVAFTCFWSKVYIVNLAPGYPLVLFRWFSPAAATDLSICCTGCLASCLSVGTVNRASTLRFLACRSPRAWKLPPGQVCLPGTGVLAAEAHLLTAWAGRVSGRARVRVCWLTLGLQGAKPLLCLMHSMG